MNGSLVWITRALSTIKPATTPRLFAVRLGFDRLPTSDNRAGGVDALIDDTGKDLRCGVGEVARIKREFEGAVNLIMLRDII